VIELTVAVLIAMAIVMMAGWACQLVAHNGGWTDVFWTYGTAAICAVAALVPFAGQTAPNWRQIAVAALITLWGLRLGTYIAIRVARSPEDVRYAALRQSWGEAFQRRMFALLIVQAPATALLSVSVVMAARSPDLHVRIVDGIGAAVMVVAVVGEALADRQMKRFKAQHRGPLAVCDSGLWAWSRHPNYFFEFVGWLAYPVIAIETSRPWSWMSLLAPTVMFGLLRYGTGVPPLEAAMRRSKGAAYARYQALVGPFVPRPPRTVDERPRED